MNPYDTFPRQSNIPGRIGFWIGLCSLIVFISLVFMINTGLNIGIFGAGLIIIALFIMFANIFVALIGFIISLIGLLIPMVRKRDAVFGFLFNTISLTGPFILAVFAINKVIQAVITIGNIIKPFQ